MHRMTEETDQLHEPLYISGNSTSTVLLSAEDLLAIQETLSLLAVPSMLDSIKAGIVESFATSDKTLSW